jgi:hypothetical protein
MSPYDRRMDDRPQKDILRDEWHAVVSDDWMETAIAWLEDKWGRDRACPYCGNDTWAINHYLIASENWATGSVQPRFIVTCTNCAQVVHIDAEKAGVVTREPGTEPPPDPPDQAYPKQGEST